MTAFLEDLFSLAGRVAVITGGSSGIGAGMAGALARAGAQVVLIARDTERLGAAVEELRSWSGRAAWVSADLADRAEVERAAGEAAGAFGPPDILVNCAGINLRPPLSSLTPADWDLTMAVNLKAPFLVAQSVGRRMIAQGRGRIVNIASQAALVALHGHVAYATSKAAIIGMTKVMAYEWGPKGVTVNSVSPTVVNTELGRLAWAGDVGTAFRAKIPTGRFAEPDEIAIAVLYLAGNAAGMVNGENLVVDGGYTIQ